MLLYRVDAFLVVDSISDRVHLHQLVGHGLDVNFRNVQYPLRGRYHAISLFFGIKIELCSKFRDIEVNKTQVVTKRLQFPLNHFNTSIFA